MLRTLSLTLIFSLGEIHMGSTTLCGTHFQSVGPKLISPNRGVSVRVLKSVHSTPRVFMG